MRRLSGSKHNRDSCRCPTIYRSDRTGHGAAASRAIGLTWRTVCGNEGSSDGRYDVGKDDAAGQIASVRDGVSESDVIPDPDRIRRDGLRDRQINRRTEFRQESVSVCATAQSGLSAVGVVGKLIEFVSPTT